MIREDLRRLRAQQRKIAIRPLTYFVEWITVYAVRRYYGIRLDRGWDALVEHEFRRELGRVANAGAFRYFGIRNAAELGDPDVIVRQLDRMGTIAVDPRPIVRLILQRGAVANGWVETGDLSLSDLE